MRAPVFSIVMLCLVLLAGPQSRPAAAQEVPYEVEITGIEDEDLQDRLEAVSTLVQRRDRVPASVTVLHRRLQEDLRQLEAAMHSWGYFGSDIEPRVDERAKPVRVTVEITPGPLYRFGETTLRPVEGEAPLPEAVGRLGDLGLETGKPFRAAAVLEAERLVETRLGWNGHPFARVAGRQVVVDHARQVVETTFTLAPGPRAHFGEVRISGLTSVSRKLVENRLPWQRGQYWDSRKIAAGRDALSQTGLFSSIRLEPAASVGEDGELPVHVELGEAQHRSIGAGLAYSTSEGPGARLFWEHRNLFDHGQRLRIDLEASQVRSGFGGEYRQPDFLRPDQVLRLGAEAVQEETDAYDSRRVGVMGGVERQFGRRLAGGAGVSVERIWSERLGESTVDTLVGLPLTLTFDNSDSVLDPTRGTRATLGVTPYVSAFGSNRQFVILRATDSIYWRLDSDGSYVLALRAAVGSILGESRDDIPPDRRFYAGGGGSVRGYAYQEAGPLDSANRPLGGRSLLNAGAEFRLRITETIGLVPFVEAASVSSDSLPSLDEDIFVGAGLGLRYYTAIGPVRVDFGVPLDRRGGIDSAFQIYASIGQAF